MERYFTVTEESSLYKDWFDYQKNAADVNAVVKSFMNKHNIGSNKYYAADDAIFIIPTAADNETYKTVLCSPLENGLRKFRTTSKIGKAWVNELKAANLKVVRKPMVIMYFRSFKGGKYRSRIFDQDGCLYCSIDPVDGDPPKGFVEMKASEFYKIVEEIS